MRRRFNGRGEANRRSGGGGATGASRVPKLPMVQRSDPRSSLATGRRGQALAYADRWSWSRPARWDSAGPASAPSPVSGGSRPDGRHPQAVSQYIRRGGDAARWSTTAERPGACRRVSEEGLVKSGPAEGRVIQTAPKKEACRGRAGGRGPTARESDCVAIGKSSSARLFGLTEASFADARRTAALPRLYTRPVSDWGAALWTSMLGKRLRASPRDLRRRSAAGLGTWPRRRLWHYHGSAAECATCAFRLSSRHPELVALRPVGRTCTPFPMAISGPRFLGVDHQSHSLRFTNWTLRSWLALWRSWSQGFASASSSPGMFGTIGRDRETMQCSSNSCFTSLNADKKDCPEDGKTHRQRHMRTGRRGNVTKRSGPDTGYEEPGVKTRVLSSPRPLPSIPEAPVAPSPPWPCSLPDPSDCLPVPGPPP